MTDITKGDVIKCEAEARVSMWTTDDEVKRVTNALLWLISVRY